jgi:hypothetical protein
VCLRVPTPKAIHVERLVPNVRLGAAFEPLVRDEIIGSRCSTIAMSCVGLEIMIARAARTKAETEAQSADGVRTNPSGPDPVPTASQAVWLASVDHRPSHRSPTSSCQLRCPAAHDRLQMSARARHTQDYLPLSLHAPNLQLRRDAVLQDHIVSDTHLRICLRRCSDPL